METNYNTTAKASWFPPTHRASKTAKLARKAVFPSSKNSYMEFFQNLLFSFPREKFFKENKFFFFFSSWKFLKKTNPFFFFSWWKFLKKTNPFSPMEIFKEKNLLVYFFKFFQKSLYPKNIWLLCYNFAICYMFILFIFMFLKCIFYRKRSSTRGATPAKSSGNYILCIWDINMYSWIGTSKRLHMLTFIDVV